MIALLLLLLSLSLSLSLWLNNDNDINDNINDIINEIAINNVNDTIMINNINNINNNNIITIMNKIMTINTMYIFKLDNNTLIAYINKPKQLLQQSSYNIYSQNGEDGILDKIYSIIGTNSKIAIEFGAWDGFHLSNTAHLWSNKGWKGILIESNIERYEQLLSSISSYNCHAIHDTVGIDNNSLEEILKRNNETNNDIDLLSIDIDSDDYHVFESLTLLKCRIVIVEYNPTIPATLDVYQEYNNGQLGASVYAWNRIGISKNMTIVAITATNVIFVLNEFIPLLEKEYDFDINTMKNDDKLQYFITDYSGNHAIISGNFFNDPYNTKDNIINTFNHGDNTLITTNLRKRIVEIIINEDIKAGTVYRTKAKGVVNDPYVEFLVEKDLKAGTKVFLPI